MSADFLRQHPYSPRFQIEEVFMKAESLIFINWAITLGVFLVIVIAIARFRTVPAARSHLQTVVTVLGVLGTFIGIFLGLVNFDPGNLQSSVPDLLAGLKTAFLTSIFGMVATLSLKWQAMREARRGSAAPASRLEAAAAAVSGIEAHLGSINEKVIEQAKASTAALRETREAMEGLKEEIVDFSKNVEAQTDATTKIVAKALGQMQTFFEAATRNLDKKIERFDQALEQELTNSLRSLGATLGALSGKFASDYTPLAEKLQKVVELAERLETAAGSPASAGSATVVTLRKPAR